MTWADLREKLNAALADDTVLVVANVELAWEDGAEGASFHMSWNEPATPPPLVRIGKL